MEQVQRKHPLAECEKCPLYKDGSFVGTRKPSTQPSNGTRLVIVGEAPGVQEAHFGIPFIGPSGKLLNKVLEHYRINRSDVTLTNACLCRPNDGTTPPKSAFGSCRPRLMDDLRDATEVLALGNSAAQSILGTTQGITSVRVGPAKDWQGKKLVASFHPAACLRSGDLFPSLVNDVGKLIRHQPVWEPPKYLVVDEEDRALEAIQQLHTLTKELVVDIECGIDKDESFDHPNEFQMLCIGVAYGKNKAVVFGENSLTKNVYEALTQLFKNKKLIAHNGKFDLAGLFPHLGAQRLYFDTMLAHYCLDERPGNHGLKYLAVELLGAPQYDSEIHQYLGKGRNYASIPRPLLYKYNAYDVAVTWDLKEVFESDLERLKLRDLHEFLVSASNEIMFTELNGIKLDLKENKKLEEQYLQILADQEDILDKFCDRDYDKAGGINPRSPKQLKEFFADHKLILPSTDKDHLETALERLIPGSKVANFIQGLLEHRRKAKLYGTYVKGIRSRAYRGRIFTTYLLHGTTSGRLASRNPNLQNIVRDNSIRRQFVVSKPENIFGHFDYKQAEGRVMCTLAQDDYLRDILSDPTRDIFDELGKRLYGKEDKLTKDERVRVKAYFYGIGYGREAYSIAMEYGWSVRQAETDLQKFKSLIPGVVEWQNNVQRDILQGKDLVTSFGRHRRFALITRENRSDVLKEGLSFYPQSTASDICLRAFIRIRPQLRGLGYIRLTIHDALVVECKEENFDQVSTIVTTEMVNSGRQWTDYVPFTVDMSKGTNWGDL